MSFYEITFERKVPSEKWIYLIKIILAFYLFDLIFKSIFFFQIKILSIQQVKHNPNTKSLGPFIKKIMYRSFFSGIFFR